MFIAGMVLSIVVAFVVARLAKVSERSTRRAIYAVVGFSGLFLSWYIAFRLIRP